VIFASFVHQRAMLLSAHSRRAPKIFLLSQTSFTRW